MDRHATAEHHIFELLRAQLGDAEARETLKRGGADMQKLNEQTLAKLRADVESQNNLFLSVKGTAAKAAAGSMRSIHTMMNFWLDRGFVQRGVDLGHDSVEKALDRITGRWDGRQSREDVQAEREADQILREHLDGTMLRVDPHREMGNCNFVVIPGGKRSTHEKILTENAEQELGIVSLARKFPRTGHESQVRENISLENRSLENRSLENQDPEGYTVIACWDLHDLMRHIRGVVSSRKGVGFTYKQLSTMDTPSHWKTIRVPDFWNHRSVFSNEELVLIMHWYKASREYSMFFKNKSVSSARRAKVLRMSAKIVPSGTEQLELFVNEQNAVWEHGTSKLKGVTMWIWKRTKKIFSWFASFRVAVALMHASAAISCAAVQFLVYYNSMDGPELMKTLAHYTVGGLLMDIGRIVKEWILVNGCDALIKPFFDRLGNLFPFMTQFGTMINDWCRVKPSGWFGQAQQFKQDGGAFISLLMALIGTGHKAVAAAGVVGVGAVALARFSTAVQVTREYNMFQLFVESLSNFGRGFGLQWGTALDRLGILGAITVASFSGPKLWCDWFLIGTSPLDIDPKHNEIEDARYRKARACHKLFRGLQLLNKGSVLLDTAINTVAELMFLANSSGWSVPREFMGIQGGLCTRIVKNLRENGEYQNIHPLMHPMHPMMNPMVQHELRKAVGAQLALQAGPPPL